MKITNSFTLSKEELADLFVNLSESLRNSNSLEIQVKGNAASLDVGETLETELSITENSFSLNLNWDMVQKPIVESSDNKEVDWRSQFDKDMSEAGLSIPTSEIAAESIVDEPKDTFIPYVKEVKLAEEIPTTQIPQVESDEIVEEEVVERYLPERIYLNTTTMSYDPGVWTSSFNIDDTKVWMEINFGEDLENKKWDVDESEITAPSISSPAPSRRQSFSSSKNDDDDLFSALDNLDVKKPKKKEKTKVAKIDRNQHKKVKVSSPNIPSAKKVIHEENIVNWKEPEREDNQTADSWVKPSEFLKKKKVMNAINKPVIPNPSGSPPTSAAVEEINQWRTPKKDSIPEDKWKKSSDRIGKKKKIPSPEGSDDPRFSKAPVAPDKKKKGKKGKKGKKDKGWAEW